MPDLTFSIMGHTADSYEMMRPVLDEFEREHHINVDLIVIPWNWNDVLQIALSNRGPDVSEMGSTWVSSLAAMNALRPFANAEQKSLGSEEAFLESAWLSCKLPDSPEIWAIPWLVDLRALYYRRDWLEKTGITDAEEAFASFDAMEQTCEKLRDSGVRLPWITFTNRNVQLLHTVVSWIWGAGGNLISEDGSHVTFDQTPAKVGLQAYFSLYRFFANDVDSTQTPWELFMDGKAASVVSGMWTAAYQKAIDPLKLSTWGVYPGPGIPFIGGTNLIIWKHSARANHAKDLIKFLTNRPAQLPYSPHAHQLPSRMEALDALAYDESPLVRSFVKIAKSGRSLPSTSLWGLIEDNLLNALGFICENIRNNPDNELQETIDNYINPIAHRMNMILKK